MTPDEWAALLDERRPVCQSCGRHGTTLNGRCGSCYGVGRITHTTHHSQEADTQ